MIRLRALVILALIGCSENIDTTYDEPETAKSKAHDSITETGNNIAVSSKEVTSLDDTPDTAFVELMRPDLFIMDMRYADTNNFLHQKVYECPQCLLRYEVAIKLLEANKYFRSLGYQIVIFDCYRPLSVQRKMWSILPDGRYVANPKNGSIHNRGGAVDITLANAEGEYLDMGTEFDHFGEEAHFAYTALSDTVKTNRQFLRTGMEKNGFTGLRTEWWHFNAAGSKDYPVSDFSVSCE